MVGGASWVVREMLHVHKTLLSRLHMSSDILELCSEGLDEASSAMLIKVLPERFLFFCAFVVLLEFPRQCSASDMCQTGFWRSVGIILWFS
jgi:hypothetical protein